MSPWIPWLYIYGVGGLVFLACVVLALRAGAVRPGHRPDRLLLGVLAGGLLVFMTAHAVWIALVT
jgi:hypothetical protein